MAIQFAAGQDASIAFLLELNRNQSLYSFPMPGNHHVAVGWNPDATVDPQFVTFGHDDDDLNLAIFCEEYISEAKVHTLSKTVLLTQADEQLTFADRALILKELGGSLQEQVILPDQCSITNSPPRWIVNSQIESLLICFEGSFDPFELRTATLQIDNT